MVLQKAQHDKQDKPKTKVTQYGDATNKLQSFSDIAFGGGHRRCIGSSNTAQQDVHDGRKHLQQLWLHGLRSTRQLVRDVKHPALAHWLNCLPACA